MQGTDETTGQVPTTPRLRRAAEALGLVGIWMALGFALRPDPNLYLILGVPLTVGFQVVVRKRRLEDLWVRGGTPFPRTWVMRVAVVAVIATIALTLLTNVPVAISLWAAAALVGASGAVYSLRRGNRDTMRLGAACLGTGGTIGVLFMVLAAATGNASDRIVPIRLAIGATFLPLYFAVSFVLEEVTFRGAVDSHVHELGEPRSLLSASLVSAMWGLWHLPMSDGALAITTSQLLVVHVPIGIALSLYWRRSGNLAVPALTHAFIDAVRNALLT